MGDTLVSVPNHVFADCPADVRLETAMWACRDEAGMAHWIPFVDPIHNTVPCWLRLPEGPRGGDAVRLVSEWRWGGLPLGSIGIINGYTDYPALRDDAVSIIFNTTPFIGRDHNSREHASCSGGPGTIATPVGELELTAEVIEKLCWMWKDGAPRGDNALYYRRECRVWEWRPTNG